MLKTWLNETTITLRDSVDSWSQALASALETELGIPAERQVWHEREAEN